MKKLFISLILCATVSSKVYAHEIVYRTPEVSFVDSTEVIVNKDTINTKAKEEPWNGVLVISEKMPEFPGGNTALFEFIKNNIQYPANAKKLSIQGMVVIRFIVGIDGSLSDCQIVRSVDPELDEEAIRVVKLMPKWIPGENAGKKVKVYFNLPVRFRLNQ